MPRRIRPPRHGTSIASYSDGGIHWGQAGVRHDKPRQQKIIRERRQYNQWVASQTLEDYALRYTAQRARKSTSASGNTALGPIAFLACEAIGGTLTLLYGFTNVAWAIGAFAVLMFLIGLPIAYYAAKYGVDIDLLTRGAGFGYMGSTVTSLIYASFTFLLFAIEASIMSVALNLVFDIPMWLAHILQLAGGDSHRAVRHQPHQPDADRHAAHLAGAAVRAHRRHRLEEPAGDRRVDAASPAREGSAGRLRSTSLLFGLAASVLLSLLPQIGEQVDYLRFLPDKHRARIAWAGGPP